MPYALFEKDDQLSRSFPTQEEVWKHADDAGLVMDDNGEPKLEDHYSPASLKMTATCESLSRQASDGGDSWPGKRSPSRST